MQPLCSRSRLSLSGRYDREAVRVGKAPQHSRSDVVEGEHAITNASAGNEPGLGSLGRDVVGQHNPRQRLHVTAAEATDQGLRQRQEGNDRSQRIARQPDETAA